MDVKYQISVFRARTLVFTGELIGSQQRDEYGCLEDTCTAEEFDQAAFAIEQAINAQTDLRCHVLEKPE